MTLKCDFDLESALRSHWYAHRITERNIWVKFNENRLIRFMRYGVQTNWRVYHMTLKCDLDITFAKPGHRFCT